MKTNLKTSILAFAMMVSVTSAFATDIASAFSGKKSATYDWVRLDKTTQNPIPGSETTGTEANPYPSQCQGGTTTVCAQGTLDGASSPSLFYFYN